MKPLVFILYLLPICVYAGGRVHNTIHNHIDECSLSAATSASNMHAYEATKAWQLMFSAGHTDTCTTNMIGVAKKFTDTGPLISITAGKTSNDSSIGAGVLWVIK